jgi:hypothetical protein
MAASYYATDLLLPKAVVGGHQADDSGHHMLCIT